MAIIQGVFEGVNPVGGAAAIPTSAATWLAALPAVQVPTHLWGDWSVASAGPVDGIGAYDLDTDAGSPTYQASWGGPGGGTCIEASGTTSSLISTLTAVTPVDGLWALWVRFYNPAQGSGNMNIASKRATDGISIVFDHSNDRLLCTGNDAGSANCIITGLSGLYEKYLDAFFVQTSSTRLDAWVAEIGSETVSTDDVTKTGGEDYGDTSVGFEFLSGNGSTIAGAQVKAGAYWNLPSTALDLDDFNLIRAVR